MMLYSSNRNILKKGRAATVLEQIDSVGSNEDKDSDLSGSQLSQWNNFNAIVDHYRKNEIGGGDDEPEVSNAKGKMKKLLSHGSAENLMAIKKPSLNLTPKSF